MRSKEVDEAIKSLEKFVNQKYYNGVTADEMKTVLSYIEQLENLPNKIRGELEQLTKKLDEAEQLNVSATRFALIQKLNYKIETLNEIIGE